ncbi:MAG: thiamine-phosphate kinase [Deltaproteobacteria bacterium]|nr:thiamine-phosphate kinase [Deltaproteobacteria bacterium]
MDEFQLIRRFTRPAPRAGAGVLLGIGDDAALLRPRRGQALVATVDAVVEGVHFDARFRPEDVGWKALAVNLSDLAAMGARPRWALCALALPRGAAPARLLGVGRGLAACARRFGVALVGGNVTRARELSLTVTALGEVPPRLALRRDGARPGHLLLASGALGDAALGLRRGAPAACIRRQRRPEPRVALGLALRGLASACIDVSDGLAQDLGHLCQASGVGAEVWALDLPTSRAFDRARLPPALRLELLVTGGEDYELLASVPRRRVPRALAAAAALGVPLSVVGEVTAGSGLRLRDLAGRPWQPRRAGHDHLRQG